MPSADFNAAAEDAKKLEPQPNSAQLVKLYGWYMQVAVGDNNTDKPEDEGGCIANLKCQAWADVCGASPEAAEKNYTDLVEKLKEKQ